MRVYNSVFEIDQPLNASFEGEALQLNQMYGYSIQVVWTGTLNGSFKLQASCDANNSGYDPVNWTDISDTATTISQDGDFMWNVLYCMYNWVRLVYTDASGGTSTAILTTATFNGKGN